LLNLINMENKKSNIQDPDIVFSKSVSSGKRIYYLDVKKNWQGKLFLTITESKKILIKDASQPTVHFEKYKIFIFKEDLDNFLSALNETISYIKDNDTIDISYPPDDKENFDDSIHLKIDF